MYKKELLDKFFHNNNFIIDNNVISQHIDSINEAIWLSQECKLNDISVSIENVELLYDKFLNLLKDFMNNEYGDCYSEKYYNSLIGTWLYHSIYKNIYMHEIVRRNIKYRNKIKYKIYKNNEYLATKDLNDAYNKMENDDVYNILIYSIHLSYIYNNELSEDSINRVENLFFYKKKHKILQIIKKPQKIVNYILFYLIDLVLSIMSEQFCYKNKIVVKVLCANTLRRKTNLILLILKSKFNILFYFKKNKIKDIFYNKDLRVKLQNYLINRSKTEIEKIFSVVIALTMPKIYLEGYVYAKNKIRPMIKAGVPKGIFRVGPYTPDSDLFEYYNAFWRENNIISANIQHGLNYEFENTGGDEYYSSDIFFSWGSLYSNLIIAKNNVVMKKSCAWDLKKEFKYKKDNKTILYSVTEHGKYGWTFLYSNYFQYIKDTTVLLNSIDNNIRRNILIRVRHGMDKNWRYKNKLLLQCPWVKLSYADNKSFIRELEEARIFVCDNISTCIAEAIINNVPTVIYLNDKIIEKNLYDECDEILQKLQKVNILFYNPKQAAEHLNNIYNNVDEWWQSENIQSVRKEFIDNYINVDSNWMDMWIKKLYSIY